MTNTPKTTIEMLNARERVNNLTKVAEAMIDALCASPVMDDHIDSCDAIVSTNGSEVTFTMSKLVDGGPGVRPSRPGRFVRYRVTVVEMHIDDDDEDD